MFWNVVTHVSVSSGVVSPSLVVTILVLVSEPRLFDVCRRTVCVLAEVFRMMFSQPAKPPFVGTNTLAADLGVAHGPDRRHHLAPAALGVAGPFWLYTAMFAGCTGPPTLLRSRQTALKP